MLAYLSDEEQTLRYYADKASAFTRSWGKAAENLGLQNGVTAEQFTRLFHGQHPDTGEQLAKTGYKTLIHEDGTTETVATRTPMIDVVYGTPKSLAVLYVEASPELREKLDEVLLEAAKAAHNAMESSARLARVSVKAPSEIGERRTKQQGSLTERVTADLIALPVVQYTARHTDESVNRGVPDPQIHVHVPIFTLCQVGDKWLTADEYGMKSKSNAKYRDSVFMGELARGLESLGVTLEYNEFDRARNGEVRWEVKDSDPELRRYWSTNNEKAWRIRREYEEQHGKPIDEVFLQKILKTTRRHKTKAAKEQDSHPNWQLWRDDATRAGFRLGHVTLDRPITHNPYKAERILRERLVGSNGLCRDDASFDDATIGQAVRRCAVGLGFSQEELAGFERNLRSGDDLILMRDAIDPEHRLFTTRTMLDAEGNIQNTRARKTKHWVDITGPAGTGKSTMLADAVHAIRTGRSKTKLNEQQTKAARAIYTTAKDVEEVVCVSMAASTAERTGQKIAADHWGSVESVVSRIEKGAIKPSAKTLVVIEEAGQLDTLRMDKLLKAVRDARIVTLGDAGQLAAIGAAGWYADALVRHGSIELTEVRRQKDQRDVADLDLIRKGRVAEALRNLEARGRLNLAADQSERAGVMFAKYAELRDAKVRAEDVKMIFNGSNAEVDAANRAVDRYRIARGEVSPYFIEVESEEQGRRWHLHDNDNVIMLSTVRVRGGDPIKNGTTGVIRRINLRTNQVRIRFDNGREETLSASDAIGKGDGVHIQKYQGGEVPYALNGPSEQTSRNALYTMASRGTVETHIFAMGSRNDLAEQMQREEVKESASHAFERIRAESQVAVMPPAYSDELILDDIVLDPVPEFFEVKGLPPQVIREQTLEQTLDQDIEMGL